MKMLVIIIFLSLVWSCNESKTQYSQTKVEMLNLARKFTDRHLEFSGLEWHGDTLFLLTQIPYR